MREERGREREGEGGEREKERESVWEGERDGSKPGLTSLMW